MNATALGLFALIQALTWNGRIYWTYPSALEGRWSGGGPYLSHTHLAESLNLALGLALGLLLGGDRSSGPLSRSGRIWSCVRRGRVGAGRGHVALTWRVSRDARRRVGDTDRHAVEGTAAWGGLAVVIVLPLLFLSVLGDSVPYVARLETLFDTGERLRRAAGGLEPSVGRLVGAADLGIGFWHVRPGGRRRSRAGDQHLLRPCGERIRRIAGRIGVGWVRSGIDAACLGRGAQRTWLTAAPANRTLILGAAGGLLAVLVNCISDFGLHIPGVAVAATVVFAHLCRLGAGDSGTFGSVRLGATNGRRWCWACRPAE